MGLPLLALAAVLSAALVRFLTPGLRHQMTLWTAMYLLQPQLALGPVAVRARRVHPAVLSQQLVQTLPRLVRQLPPAGLVRPQAPPTPAAVPWLPPVPSEPGMRISTMVASRCACLCHSRSRGRGSLGTAGRPRVGVCMAYAVAATGKTAA